MKKLFLGFTLASLLTLSACDGQKAYHDITDTDSIATETEQAPEEETPFLDDNTTPLNDVEQMQAQALCGQWGWVDTDKEDDLPLLFTLGMEDEQLSVIQCAIYGSTAGEMTPQCSYRNGVFKMEDTYEAGHQQHHLRLTLELNPRGDLVGTYHLKLSPDNISEGTLTMRNGYFKYGENNEEE